MTAFREFAPDLRPVRGLLAAGVGASGLAAVMEWAGPWPLKFIFDSVIGTRALPAWLAWLPSRHGGLLAALAGFMILIASLLAASGYLSTRLVATAGQRVVLETRLRLFRHLEAQRLSFHQQRSTGDLLARLGGDVQAVQSAIVTALPTLLRNTLTLLGMVAIMVVVDWRFALLALSLMPVIGWATTHYLRRITAIQRRARRADGDAGGVAQEVLSSLGVVQAFGAEGLEADRYARAVRRGLEENRRAIVAQSEFTPLMTLLMTLSTVLVLYFGVRGVGAGHLSPGDLLVFMAYLKGMYSPIRQLSKLAGVLARAEASAGRVAEVLAVDERVPEEPSARPLRRARGAISFRDVSFSHDAMTRVLDGVDLEVPVGARQAVVGLTGSGKSTLLRLVARFVDPTSGLVLLDGTDVSQLRLGDLRRQIAYVPQEPYLFRGSVWENIAYGSAAPDRRAAVAAARLAGLHDVIESFPDGYDTEIAERGSTLSGGQRQCVAVARAMARRAPVLLLDEPTVGLDAELESILVGALDQVTARCTTIMVSHQLWGLRSADQIAVLVDGRIAECGSHDELVRLRSVYWRLDRLQQGATLAVAELAPPPDPGSAALAASGGESR